MNKTILFIGLICSAFVVKGQTTLNRGDLAILGVNSNINGSSQDEISFVCFKDITTGTTLQITDNGYEACTPGLWGSAEGGATLTRTGGTIKAGTVITFQDGGTIKFTYPDANWSATDLLLGIIIAANVNLNSKGDQLYIAQNGTWTVDTSNCSIGGASTPNGDYPGINGRILFGFSTSGGWKSFQGSTEASGLYPGMDCFTMAPSGTSEFNKYTSPLTSATQTAWLARINTQSNWTSYKTSPLYFSASPDLHSLIIPIAPSGAIPTPTWTSPSPLCVSSGTLDLNTLVTGTEGGTWSGTGISASGIFNPSGLNGTYNITYSVNYSSGTSICPLTQTDTISVTPLVTPTFNAIPTLIKGSVPPVLPTTSTNTQPITGTWNAAISTATVGTTTYTFTPATNSCSNIATLNVVVIGPTTTTSCAGNTLTLPNTSNASEIAWYKDGKIDTTIYQSFATVGFTVAGGNGLGANNNQFNRPYGVAVDANSNVYVSDYYNDRVMEWAKNAITGTIFAGTTGVNSHANNQLYNPTGLYLSSTGSLFIGDYNNHRVEKYLPGSSTGMLAAGNNSSGNGAGNITYPCGIYVDRDSNVFVSDAGNYPPPVILQNPSISNRIMEWPSGAAAGTLAAGSTAGAGLASNQLAYPTGVYVKKNGDIYVADFGNKRIQKWAKGASQGTTVADLSNLGTGGVNPSDVWVDEATGILYITATNEVVDYQPFFFNGTDNYLLKWVEGASSGTIMNGGTASGNKLYTPISLTIGYDGSLYVGDRGNNRVQKWATSIDTTFTPTKAGSYFAVISTASGMVDTTNTIIVTTPDTSTNTATICAGDAYTFNGKSYDSSGTYSANLMTAAGCDTVANLVLTVKYPTSSTAYDTICAGSSYTFNGKTYDSSGIYTVHFANAAGCDSTANLNLTVAYPTSSSTPISICVGSSYIFNGKSYDSSGTYTANLKNSKGCDSTATLVLNVKYSVTSTTYDSICAGSSFTFNGISYDSSGIYSAHYTNAAGCDSNAKLVLTVKYPTSSTSTASICAGNPYPFNGKSYDSAGTYITHLTNSVGCDSAATLVLSVKYPTSSTSTVSICAGSSYKFNSKFYDSAGIYTAQFTNAVGCDSTANLILTVKYPTSSTTAASICAGNSYTFNGKSYDSSGTYTANLKNSNGCDSTASLILNVKYPTSSITAASICAGDSYAFNGKSYDSSGTYTANLMNTNGCDSSANLVLTVKYATSSTTSASICAGNSYIFNGKVYDSTGTYTASLMNSNGCDSTASLVLTVKYPTSSTTSASICTGSSYLFNGKSYNTPGTYPVNLTNAVGCDSVAKLVLTVNPPSTLSTTASICTGGSYIFNGKSYNSVGTYKDTLVSSAGCDSIVTLILTLAPPSTSTTNASICLGGSYVFNRKSYNNAGTYIDTLTNSAGCDSIATLTLTLATPSTSTTTKGICMDSSFIFNSKSYNSPGTYMDTLMNSAGCDSIATLVLKWDSAVTPYPITTSSNEICKDATTTLSDLTTGGSWTSLDPTIASVDNNSGVVMGLDTGMATIKYTLSNTCAIEYTTTVITILGVKPTSVVPILKDATCLNPQSGSIHLAIKGTEGPYHFTFNGIMYDTTYTVPNLPVGIYTFYIYNNAGCYVGSYTPPSIMLDPDASCDTLYVPTGFIPTSTNGVNNVLKPFGGTTSIQSFTFKVFNRYGNIVFETHDLNTGWDGKINGSIQETGTYIWYLEYTKDNGKPRSGKGTSVLIR